MQTDVIDDLAAAISLGDPIDEQPSPDRLDCWSNDAVRLAGMMDGLVADGAPFLLSVDRFDGRFNRASYT
jgi:hypothetical protein